MKIEDIEQALIDLEEYFDNKADADYDYATQQMYPNEEMRLLKFVLELQEYFEKIKQNAN